jgi:hypothetical protein
MEQIDQMELITVYDCPGENLSKIAIPPGVEMAGYITGTGSVPWTTEQLAAHPDAIRIDQAPTNTPANETADVFDVENGAGTLEDIPQWVHAAANAFHANARPGQRNPTIYMNRSTMTPVANTLIAAGILSGVNLWLAAPMTPAEAAHLVTNAGGPYPIVGVQFAFNGDHDVSVFSATWFDNQSGKPHLSFPRPGIQPGWRFCSKCQSLFYGPGETISHCPAGGAHYGPHSHNYDLPYLS